MNKCVLIPFSHLTHHYGFKIDIIYIYITYYINQSLSEGGSGSRENRKQRKSAASVNRNRPLQSPSDDLSFVIT